MKKRKVYTSQFKHEAVRLMESSDQPAADVARQPGVQHNQLDKRKERSIKRWRESHREKPVQAAKGAQGEIAAILRRQTIKVLPRRKLSELCENQIATVHRCLPEKPRMPVDNDNVKSNR